MKHCPHHPRLNSKPMQAKCHRIPCKHSRFRRIRISREQPKKSQCIRISWFWIGMQNMGQRRGSWSNPIVVVFDVFTSNFQGKSWLCVQHSTAKTNWNSSISNTISFKPYRIWIICVIWYSWTFMTIKSSASVVLAICWTWGSSCSAKIAYRK